MWFLSQLMQLIVVTLHKKMASVSSFSFHWKNNLEQDQNLRSKVFNYTKSTIP